MPHCVYTLCVDDLTPAHPPVVLSTSARLSLGSTSLAISTQEHLRFQLDHALARDAIHAPLDVAGLVRGLHDRNFEAILLQSAVLNEKNTRRAYLRRPDLGRTLSSTSAELLRSQVSKDAPSRPEPSIAIVLADGLSALALERHALPLLDVLLPSLSSLLSPLITVATNARVAIGDEIGSLLHANLTLLLIGERPGLSSPDSLGCYITWQPRSGRTDAERNCISNIRAEGLSYAEAAHRIAYYVDQAFKLHTTGIALKDPEPPSPLLASPSAPPDRT